jgi:hypothetical protein
MKHPISGILLVVLSLLNVSNMSCARSKAFDRDQEVYGDYPQSYYTDAQKNSSISKKVDTLGQPKKRVVVFNFWNSTPVRSKDSGAFASDELKRALLSTRRVIIPEDVRVSLETLDYIQGDDVKVAQLIMQGRKLGVAVIVIGRISRIVFRQSGDDVGIIRQKQSRAAVDVEAKIFDVNSGREITAIGKSGYATIDASVSIAVESVESRKYREELTQLALRDAAVKLVPDILLGIEKMQWEGKIAKVSQDRVFLSSGKTSGLVGGDILRATQRHCRSSGFFRRRWRSRSTPFRRKVSGW